MARRRSDKALGSDPLDALEDIEWIIQEEPVAEPRADVAPERAIAEAEPSTDGVSAEVESTSGQRGAQSGPGTKSGMQSVEGTTDADDRAHPAGSAVEPTSGAEEDAASLPSAPEGAASLPPLPADDGDEDQVVEAAEAVAEPDANESQATEPTDKPALPPAADEGDAEDDREDGVPSEWPFEEDGVPSERPFEEDEEVCHLLDELIAAIDQDVEQTLQPEAVADLAAAAPARPEDEEQYVIFTLTGAEYAVPISNVIEIGRPLNVTPVPNVPNWVVGVANLRGDIISVVDLPAFLGMERTGYGHASRMLVAQAYQGQLTTGLIVDRVSGIWYLPVDQIGAPAAPIEDRVTPYLHGVYEHDGQLLVVLDLDRLLLSPEMRQFEPV